MEKKNIACKTLCYILESSRDDRGGMQVSYKSGGSNALCSIGHSPAKRDPSASLWIYFLTHAVGWPADFNLRLTDGAGLVERYLW